MTPDFPAEPVTQVTCPECDGEGVVVRSDGTTVRGARCGCCQGTGIVTVERLRAWKLGKALQP